MHGKGEDCQSPRQVVGQQEEDKEGHGHVLDVSTHLVEVGWRHRTLPFHS